MFFSPQVKWSLTISNKHDILELPHELPNDIQLILFNPTAFSPLGGPMCPHKKKKLIYEEYLKNS